MFPFTSVNAAQVPATAIDTAAFGAGVPRWFDVSLQARPGAAGSLASQNTVAGDVPAGNGPAAAIPEAGPGSATEPMAAPWLAELLTPVSTLTSTQPFLVLNEFVHQAEEAGQQLTSTLQSLGFTPWLTSTALALAAFELVRYRARQNARRAAAAIEVPEITTPSELL
jgi:hypothetical protein